MCFISCTGLVHTALCLYESTHCELRYLCLLLFFLFTWTQKPQVKRNNEILIYLKTNSSLITQPHQSWPCVSMWVECVGMSTIVNIFSRRKKPSGQNMLWGRQSNTNILIFIISLYDLERKLWALLLCRFWNSLPDESYINKSIYQ